MQVALLFSRILAFLKITNVQITNDHISHNNHQNDKNRKFLLHLDFEIRSQDSVMLIYMLGVQVHKLVDNLCHIYMFFLCIQV